MSEAINITNVARVDKKEFMASFQEESVKLLGELLVKVGNQEDRDVVQDVSMKMIALYQKMYTSSDKQVASIQRMLNNYKSVVASISARHKVDVANSIISICQKASIVALSIAIKFVAI